MKNYKMTRGRKINDIKKVVFKIIIFIFISFMIIGLFKLFEIQDSKLNKINYCWDSNGEHYVAPDERCGN